MPLYSEVVKAARETVAAITTGRMPGAHTLRLSTEGGATAAVLVTDHYSGRIRHIDMRLPSLPGDARLTRGEADRIVALIAHECCHVLHTDWRAWSSVAHHGADPAFRTLCNWIEDARIERKELRSKRLPGLLGLLSHMETMDYWSAEKARKAAGAPPCGATKSDFGAVFAYSARLMNGCTIPNVATMRRNMPAFAVPVLDMALAKFPGLKSTTDAIILAREITRALRDAEAAAAPAPAPQPVTPPPPVEDDEKDEDESEGEGAKGEDTETEAEGDSDEGESEQGEGEQEDEDAEGEGEGAEGEDEGEEKDPEPTETPDNSNQAKQDADAPGGDAKGGGEGDQGEPDATAPGEADDEDEPRTGWAGTAPGIDGLTQEDADRKLVDEITKRENCNTSHADQSPILLFDKVGEVALMPVADGAALIRARMPAPGPLRDQITRLIRSEERHGIERYRSAGRMDRRAMTRMDRGATNVFSRRTMVEGVDCAVFLLVDGSGSMNEPADEHVQMGPGVPSRSDMATALALHLAEACEAARGRAAVAQFQGGTDYAYFRYAKRFDGALDANALAGMTGNHYTPLSVAICGARDALLGETASRRIMLVLTDGGDDIGPEAVAVAVKLAEAAGIETVGIGCGIDVRYAFNRAVMVTDLTQVAEQGLAALADLLTPEDDR